MALIACPDCGTSVSDLATACPKCARPIAGQVTPVGETPAPSATKPSESAGGEAWLLGSAVALIGGMALWGLGAFSSSEARKDPDKPRLEQMFPTPVAPVVAHDGPGAWVACQGFLEDRLQSPGSANFPWFHGGQASHLGNGKYSVRSYVDSQNTSGAVMRTDFDCDVEYVDGGWKLADLKLKGR